MTDGETLDMLIEYMGKGFIENIAALLRREPDLARFIPDMIRQENLGVRLGTTALVEELVRGRRNVLNGAVPGLIALLESANPTVRGDAASLLGTIGHLSAKQPLQALLQDANDAVRTVARIALEEFGERER